MLPHSAARTVNGAGLDGVGGLASLLAVLHWVSTTAKWITVAGAAVAVVATATTLAADRCRTAGTRTPLPTALWLVRGHLVLVVVLALALRNRQTFDAIRRLARGDQLAGTEVIALVITVVGCACAVRYLAEVVGREAARVGPHAPPEPLPPVRPGRSRIDHFLALTDADDRRGELAAVARRAGCVARGGDGVVPRCTRRADPGADLGGARGAQPAAPAATTRQPADRSRAPRPRVAAPGPDGRADRRVGGGVGMALPRARWRCRRAVDADRDRHGRRVPCAPSADPARPVAVELGRATTGGTRLARRPARRAPARARVLAHRRRLRAVAAPLDPPPAAPAVGLGAGVRAQHRRRTAERHPRPLSPPRPRRPGPSSSRPRPTASATPSSQRATPSRSPACSVASCRS